MPTLLARLKGETAPEHLRLERDLGILREDRTRTEHHELVRRLYGFYRPWEDRAIPVIEAGHPGLARDRAKAPLLRRDLAYLGDSDLALASVPICRELPALGTLPECLGSMYVLEGATLGGRLISRHLARTLGLGPDAGASFFSSYGVEVGPMWRRFGEALDSYDGPLAEAIVASAQGTFRALHAWLVVAGAGVV